MTPKNAANGARAGVADTILIGDVVTLDRARPRAGAVAVAGGTILAVGSRDDIDGLRGPSTQVFDFGDAAIVPGFNDAHAHMDTEGLKHARPSLEGARSIGDVTTRIAALAKARPKGAWIVTGPVGTPPFFFDGPGALAEQRMPTRSELDRAAPDHPVCIQAPSGYWGDPPCYTVLNSLALRLNRIDASTVPRAAGVEIVKDGSGEPTGIIVDHNFREVAELDLMPAVPKFTREDRKQGILKAMQLYHAAGTTSIYEGHGSAPEVVGLYRELQDSGALTMRCGLVAGAMWSTLAEADRAMRDWLVYARGKGLGDAMLRISGVFLQYAGDLLGARLEREQAYDTGFWSHLRQMLDPAEFEALCMLCAQHDLRVHTIVSAGRLAEIAPIFERVDARIGIRSRRWVVEHLSTARMEDLRKVKALGVGVTLIPNYHLWKRGTPFLGLPDAEQAMVVPAQQLRALGIPVGAGTDNTPCSPLAVMRAMMARADRATGRPVGRGACIGAEDALEIMTAGGAWFSHEEHIKGQLIPGFHADCAVLSRNPLDTAADDMESIKCRATMVGGRFVHFAGR